MKRLIFALGMLMVGILQTQAQTTVATVHTTGGDQTACVLGPMGAIYFTAQGEQIAVKDETGVVRGFGLGMVEKVTFSEKESEPECIAEGVQPMLQAYPNPVDDFLVVESEASWVEIADLMGRVVFSLALQAPRDRLDLRALPSGIYFLRANGRTLKIVK